MIRGRVAHVVRSDAFAGVERYVCGTATELTRRGWEVSVVGGDVAAMRSGLPGSVQHVPATTTLEVARAVKGLERHDIVHAHMTAAEVAVAALKDHCFEVFISTRHFAGARGSTPWGRAAAAYVSRRLDRQIAISQYVADHIETPSTVIHNGVPSSVRTPAARTQTVVLLQRLEPEKDTPTALHAWAQSGLAAAGWQLRVYGTGSELTQLRSLAIDLDIAPSVTFEGFTADPRSVLATAGVLLAPASAEPFGLSVVEAMAEGIPVIAADGGAHRETLGPDGLYFPPGDTARAADLLRAAASDPDRGAYGHGLQQRQRQLFTLQTHVDHLEALYSEVLR